MENADFELALRLLAGFIKFTEVPDIKDVIDGAFDPDIYVVTATHLLDQYKPDWRHEEISEREYENVQAT